MINNFAELWDMGSSILFNSYTSYIAAPDFTYLIQICIDNSKRFPSNFLVSDCDRFTSVDILINSVD